MSLALSVYTTMKNLFLGIYTRQIAQKRKHVDHLCCKIPYCFLKYFLRPDPDFMICPFVSQKPMIVWWPFKAISGPCFGVFP